MICQFICLSLSLSGGFGHIKAVRNIMVSQCSGLLHTFSLGFLGVVHDETEKYEINWTLQEVNMSYLEVDPFEQ